MIHRNVLGILLGSWLAAAGPLHAERPDRLVADFERPTYGDWNVTGEAFGPGPAKGTLPGQMPVSGYKGERLVNSFYEGDGTTGTLTSPPFEIERKFINFLIGGGGYPEETCINLLVDEKTVRTATGPNRQSGGSERLHWHSWDVSAFAGQTARIQIVDRRTGGWGHINVDHIVQSDQKKQAEPAERTLSVQKPYLHLPVDNDAPERRVRFLIDGETVREFGIQLAGQSPDLWVFGHVEPFRDQELTVRVDRLPADSQGLSLIKQADRVPGAEQLYREKYRPQFHFTARRGWLNDPNGLTYFAGEWHLFFQHNPYGTQWGNMHWGHAVSEDLVHWKELPIALYPQRYGDWCFSGSGLVDENDTSGWQTGQEPPMVAAYTSTGRGEAMAYSNDRGRTWTDYEGNPVVRHTGRDPKVIWHEPTERWVMAVYNEDGGARGIAFYSSPDLKDWTRHSKIEGFYECPDLFRLPVDGDESKSKWVLYGADGEYILGHFDGRRFHKESGKHRVWHGNFYAAQTFSNTPRGRRIQIGWGRGIEFPGMPFNQQMTVPCRLTLRTTDEGPRMFAEPVEELSRLHGKTHVWRDEMLAPGENLLEAISGDTFDIRAKLAVGEAERVGFVVRGIPVAYDVGNRRLICQDVEVPLEPAEGRVRVRILVDRGSLEVFGNDGRVALSVGAIPPDDNRGLEIFTRGGPLPVESLEVGELRSAWRPRK